MKSKTTMMLAAALLVSVAFGQAKTAAKYASLASARAKITQVVDNPKDMTAVMQTLSPDDQKVFLAEVVAAISSMPSDESARTEKYVEVVNAALAGSQRGNALTLVAEVFATVPPSALTAVNESLAAGLMNRAADKNVTYTDEQYVEIAKKVMEKVNERVASEDNAGVRSGFAALMLIRGSNSESSEITSAVVGAMPESVRNDAKTEWFPAALGQNGEKSYDPMLAVVDNETAGPVSDSAAAVARQQDASRKAEEADPKVFIRIPAAQNLDSLLADINGTNHDPNATSGWFTPVIDAVQNPTKYELPNLDVGGETDEIIGKVVKEIEEAENYFRMMR